MRFFFLFLIVASSLSAFETTNIQFLHSNSFKGDAFIYDTKNGKKTTITYEHYRTWDYGDFFMFIDIMDGEKFDNSSSGVYAELAPRFSFSKILNNDFSNSILKDVYIATQLNIGNSYQAYLYGLGVNLEVPLLNFFVLNMYHKNENLNETSTYQVTLAYETASWNNIHLEGFLDLTKRDVNTHNQLLYNIDSNQHTYIGIEWLYYDYSYKSSYAKTSVIQAMIKYKF